MNQRFFVFFYVDNPEVEEYLNLAIFVANPLEKWPAHVTVAGPFPHRNSVPKAVPFHSEVNVRGVGRFNGSGQNTVFLNVESDELRKYWNKPDYGYNPHITIYDGDDPKLADMIYISLKTLDPFFSFPVKKLKRVKSVKGGPSILHSTVHQRSIKNVLRMDSKVVYSFSVLERVKAVSDAIRKAQDVSLSPERSSISSKAYWEDTFLFDDYQ